MREMKDSGIKWIGEIPANWNVFRNKNAYSCQKRIVGDECSSTQLLSLTTKGVKKKDINNAEGKQPESFDTYQFVSQDNLVMCLFDLDCSAVFSGVSDFDGMISPAYRVLQTQKNMCPRYADYWFRYISDGRKFNHYAKNIRYTLSYEEFSALPMLFPPISEQKKIASYLDSKCSIIDSIIAKQEQIIEKLKEYRIALITESVTGEQNPGMEVNDCACKQSISIPRNWQIRRLKTLASIISKGTTPSTVGKDTVDYGVIRFIKAENIQNNALCMTPENFIDEETDYLLRRSRLKENDILFVIAGATIGKTAIVGKDLLPANTNQAVSFIRLFNKDDAKYVWYSLQSYNMRTTLSLFATQAAQPNLPMWDLGNFNIYWPQKDERKHIVEHLDFACKYIEQNIEKKRSIIEKLQLYKKSLIYEVVTGKKEV